MVAFSSFPVSATDYYVNPVTGKNSNSGLEPEKAWRTISYALSQGTGDRLIHLSSGTFNQASGEVFPLTPKASTIIKGEGTDQTIISAPDGRYTFLIQDSLGPVILQDFQLKRSKGVEGAIRIAGSKGFAAERLLFFEAENGLRIVESQALVDSCVFVHCDLGIKAIKSRVDCRDCLVSAGDSTLCEGAWLEDNTFTEIIRCVILSQGRVCVNVIRGNAVIRDCLFCGCTSNSVSFSYGAEGSIVQTNCTRNGDGIHISTDKMVIARTKILSCILSDNRGVGMKESRSDTADPEFCSNLLFGNGINYLDEGVFSYNSESQINNLVGNGTATVENNIVTDPLFVGGPIGSNSSIAYASETFQSIMTDSSATWRPNKFKGAILYPNSSDNNFAYYIIGNTTNEVTVWGDITDASFAATAAGDSYEIVDYHLSRLSPAIDAGYIAGVEEGETDLDGNARVAGEGVDIGPYEFCSCPVVPTPSITLTPSQTPLPSSTPTLQPTWTPYPTYTPNHPGDLTGDGVTDVEDLLELMRFWKR